ncbi:hypothetical protein LOAG_07368 [Loa loa]|uniref:Uncharacterized protein n=1 Tax=Loa loa TaxID=7209 RepID=A0A1S0TVW2_LOALO|nr:hypothetical protein LOAG_07368 [Loa loa]EFO21122.1 hypothetical protein LOAG_07368 [Loa loa]
MAVMKIKAKVEDNIEIIRHIHPPTFQMFVKRNQSIFPCNHTRNNNKQPETFLHIRKTFDPPADRPT